MTDFALTVSDIRQFAYCQRVVYFTYVQPLERPTTYKMQHGTSTEDRTDALERRRTLQRYGIREGQRLFDHWLRSEAMQLSGRADLLIIGPEAIWPVEYKETAGGVSRNHRLQVTAYAMMAEEQFGLPAPSGFVCRLPDGMLWRVSTLGQWRQQVTQTLQRIREMIDHERFPDPPGERGKCVDCEFRRFCADV
jgi:CRISPR-associated exonuclease Cas4